jgi:hypothetical protein
MPIPLDVRAGLLEEERNTRGFALVADAARPRDLKRPRAGAALAADQDPADASQVELAQVLEQRLDREHSDGSGHLAQLVDPRDAVLPVLNADAEPEVRQRPRAVDGTPGVLPDPRSGVDGVKLRA